MGTWLRLPFALVQRLPGAATSFCANVHDTSCKRWRTEPKSPPETCGRGALLPPRPDAERLWSQGERDAKAVWAPKTDLPMASNEYLAS